MLKIQFNAVIAAFLFLSSGASLAANPTNPEQALKNAVTTPLVISHPCARYSTQRHLQRADPYKEAIETYSKRYNVDPALIKAVIAIESCYNAQAKSPKGAQGLMQLIPGTAERFGVGDAFDTTQNIQGGTRYLNWLSKRYNGDLVKVLAAYNAGEGRVDQYKGVPPFRETRHYVHNVLAVYNTLSEQPKPHFVGLPVLAKATEQLDQGIKTINKVVEQVVPAVRSFIQQVEQVQDQFAQPVAGLGRPVELAIEPHPAPSVTYADQSVQPQLIGHQGQAATRVQAVYRSPLQPVQAAPAPPSKPGRAGWQENRARAPHLYKQPSNASNFADILTPDLFAE